MQLQETTGRIRMKEKILIVYNFLFIQSFYCHPINNKLYFYV